MPELLPYVPGSPEWLAARRAGVTATDIVTLPLCHLCGNVNPVELGPVTGTCLDGRACRRRQAGLEPVNPDGGHDG